MKKLNKDHRTMTYKIKNSHKNKIGLEDGGGLQKWIGQQENI